MKLARLLGFLISVPNNRKLVRVKLLMSFGKIQNRDYKKEYLQAAVNKAKSLRCSRDLSRNFPFLVVTFIFVYQNIYFSQVSFSFRLLEFVDVSANFVRKCCVCMCL